MDVVLLSRLQFATATMFHFLFVPFTLGLSFLVAYMETRYVKTGDETYLRMTKFWGKLFLINFAIGVVTGITLEFQFGTNWSRYSAYVGDIFGSLLAIEATTSFFLESTLIGVWIFGWKKLSKKAHAAVMWLIAVASTFSAVWILIANAWMQNPVGYTIRDGRAELVDFVAVLFQKYAIFKFIHTVSAAYVLSAFFVMGVSAYHLLKKQNIDFFTRSFKTALGFGIIFSFVVVIMGDINGVIIAEKQPTKLAAMESLWETTTRAPVYLFALPDEENERNKIEIGAIPGMLSFLVRHDINSKIRGLKAFPKEERPPVLITSFAFKGMVGLGFYFILATILGWWKRNRLVDSPKYLKLMLLSIPLPYMACELGWIVAEVGRQPWIVYGLMKTSDAVSPIATSQVLTTLIGFVLVYGLLGVTGFYLIAKNALKSPELATDN
ncbi:MAG: cytochrome ubiquinol oxidase subunit I [Desulfobacteraceae bacterium]|nr:cytochrome ubiquinol oxidase subunit I [Desulfobacteraceae bacterium]MDH3719931.1 cytochrome ubiquinol oxidase subunit I [Desulfobacteraceae bacterium]MDH3835565.1 cytochrome ubiquinol oxidase subunit I [Desulfobacteraceae bacterium]MDH3872753.1 cytochrome ubiquinol oxidase subunit I [Desulfobacteraceae bacterium]MDH3882038.1 cytochrome ubiquinol oxidase subunit I [Desulfobacteraceae bacterium]